MREGGGGEGGGGSGERQGGAEILKDRVLARSPPCREISSIRNILSPLNPQDEFTALCQTLGPRYQATVLTGGELVESWIELVRIWC